MNLYNYLSAMQRVWNIQDGKAVARFLSLQDQHVNNQNIQLENPESAVYRQLNAPLDEIVSSHLKTLYHLSVDGELIILF